MRTPLSSSRRWIPIFAVGIAFAAVAVQSASANVNPPNCTDSAVAVSLGEVRNPLCSGGTNAGAACTSDSQCPGGTCLGTTIPPTGSHSGKVEGETIYYRTTLAFSTAPDACGYEGGSLCIDPPGPTGCTDVTPTKKTCQPVGGALCTTDADCPGVCVDGGGGCPSGTNCCSTGTNTGEVCTTDADCPNRCAAIPLICPAAF